MSGLGALNSWDEAGAGAKSPGTAPPQISQVHASIPHSYASKTIGRRLVAAAPPLCPAKHPNSNGPPNRARTSMTTSCSSLPKATQECDSSKSHHQTIFPSRVSASSLFWSRSQISTIKRSSRHVQHVNQGPNSLDQPLF